MCGYLQPMTLIKRPHGSLSVGALTEQHEGRNRAALISAKIHGELLVACAHQQNDYLPLGLEDHQHILTNLRQPSREHLIFCDGGPLVSRDNGFSLGQTSRAQEVDEIF